MCRLLDQEDRVYHWEVFLKEEKEWRRKEQQEIALQRLPTEEARTQLRKLWSVVKNVKTRVTTVDVEPNFSLVITPHLRDQQIEAVVETYKIPHFVSELWKFVNDLTPAEQRPRIVRARGAGRDFPFRHANVWSSLHLRVPTAQNEDILGPYHTIQAVPPTARFPDGLCNTVLVHHDDRAERTGLKGVLTSEPCPIKIVQFSHRI